MMKHNKLMIAVAASMLASAAMSTPSNMVTSSTSTLFIDRGAVYAMGKNQHGITYVGSLNSSMSTPVFTGKMDAKSVAIATNRSAILYEDGTADFAGLNFSTSMPMAGKFPASNITDIALSERTVYFITNNILYSWSGVSYEAPVQIAADVKEVSAGMAHAVFLHLDGTVSTRGETNWSPTLANMHGQLGNGTVAPATGEVLKISGVTGTSVLAGQYRSYVLQSNGTVVAWGKNTQYELGLGTNADALTPTQVPGLNNVAKLSGTGGATVALKTDGTVMACGWHNYIEGVLNNSSSNCTVLPVGTATDISASSNGRWMLSRGEEGKREGWGGNLEGSLGNGNNIETHSLVTAFFQPVVAPVVAKAVIIEPAPVAEVAPKVDALSDMAIAIPLQATAPAITMTSPEVGLVDIVISAVVDSVVAIVDTVVNVVDAVTSVVAPPTTAPAVTIVKVKNGNNGFGNGDQAAPGNSATHNNAENSQRALVAAKAAMVKAESESKEATTYAATLTKQKHPNAKAETVKASQLKVVAAEARKQWEVAVKKCGK